MHCVMLKTPPTRTGNAPGDTSECVQPNTLAPSAALAFKQGRRAELCRKL